MDKKMKFRSNIIIIIVGVVIFAFATQLARSEFALKYISSDSGASIEAWNNLLPQINVDYANDQLVLNSFEKGAHCIIIDSHDNLSVKYFKNLKYVYKQMKYHYFVQDIAKKEATYYDCEVVVNAAHLEHENINIIDLYSYIEEGGNYLLARVDDPGTNFALINRLLGIISYTYRIAQTQLTFAKPLLLGSENQTFTGDHVYNDSVQLELDNTVDVLVYGNGKLPIVWKQEQYGGNVVIYNGNNLAPKEFRGMLTGLISETLPLAIYPIFNAKLFYIDDYPAPMSTENHDMIKAEYNRNIARFFYDIWWPDMIKLAKDNNIVYSATLIQEYHEQVEPPFEKANEDSLKNLILFGREVLKLGGEIGLHGLNHQPFQFDQEVADYYGYYPWKRIEDVEIAINEVLKYGKRAFPNYSFVTYVPPSNVLSMQGRQALVDNWESLRVISSVYLTDHLNYAYVQEFEVAPDGIVEMPRITSGYQYVEFDYWVQLNIITAYGFYSHFIHPDDLISDSRSNGQNWSDMKKAFNYQLELIANNHSWLRPLTSGNAAIEVAKTLNSTIERVSKDNRLVVTANETTQEQFYIMKTDQDIGLTTGCTVEQIAPNTYLVKAATNHFEIELR